MHQQTWFSLVLVMACHLFSADRLSKSMPGLGSIPFFQFNSNSVIFNSNSNSTIHNKFKFQFRTFQFQFLFRNWNQLQRNFNKSFQSFHKRKYILFRFQCVKIFMRKKPFKSGNYIQGHISFIVTILCLYMDISAQQYVIDLHEQEASYRFHEKLVRIIPLIICNVYSRFT